jgi:hypothetical protein
MKKLLLLLLAITLGGCMTYSQAEESPTGSSAAALYPPNHPHGRVDRNVAPGEALIVAVTSAPAPDLAMAARTGDCRVADTQLPAQTFRRWILKEKK